MLQQQAATRAPTLPGFGTSHAAGSSFTSAWVLLQRVAEQLDKQRPRQRLPGWSARVQLAWHATATTTMHVRYRHTSSLLTQQQQHPEPPISTHLRS